MLNTNIAGFEYSELKNDSYYWQTVIDICRNNENYSNTNGKESEHYLCLSLLFETEPIKRLLKNGKAIEALRMMVATDKVRCFVFCFFVRCCNYCVLCIVYCVV